MPLIHLSRWLRPNPPEAPASGETRLSSTPSGAVAPPEQPSEELVAEPVVDPEAEASALERLRARFGG